MAARCSPVTVPHSPDGPQSPLSPFSSQHGLKRPPSPDSIASAPPQYEAFPSTKTRYYLTQNGALDTHSPPLLRDIKFVTGNKMATIKEFHLLVYQNGLLGISVNVKSRQISAFKEFLKQSNLENLQPDPQLLKDTKRVVYLITNYKASPEAMQKNIEAIQIIFNCFIKNSLFLISSLAPTMKMKLSTVSQTGLEDLREIVAKGSFDKPDEWILV